MRARNQRSLMLRPRVFTVGAVCSLLLLSACGDDGKGTNAQSPQSSSKAAAVEVGVVTLKRETVELSVELPGRISAYQAAEIRPQVNGIILERLFEEGGTVEKGQQLYQIDPATYQAAYDTAVAQLKRAQASLKSTRAQAERYKQLVKVNAISKQQYDDTFSLAQQAEADVAIAKAAKDTAEINLNYTKVLSPISGRIGKSSVTPGALVTANQTTPLALVQQLDPIYVDVTQSSTDLIKQRQKLNEGSISGEIVEAPVELVLDELGQKYSRTGTLKFADITVDETTGNVQIRAIFPNPHGDLLPGLFVRAILKQGDLKDVLLVPQQAITRSATGDALAWVVDAEGKAQSKPVETAQAIKDKWVVTKGLEAGDRVIVEGSLKVQAGASVTPVEIGAKESAASATTAASPKEEPPKDTGADQTDKTEEDTKQNDAKKKDQ